jgi:hypothetical protein
MHSLFKENRLLLSEATEGWRHFLETKATTDSPYPFCPTGPASQDAHRKDGYDVSSLLHRKKIHLMRLFYLK